jgi:hypothetical protein
MYGVYQVRADLADAVAGFTRVSRRRCLTSKRQEVTRALATPNGITKAPLEPVGFRVDRVTEVGSNSVYIVDKILCAIINRVGVFQHSRCRH